MYKTLDFCQGTVNNVLNRLGYSLKKVRKTLPLKRIEQTDAIFDNVAHNRKSTSPGIIRLSIDVKDKVRVGQLSRKGYHRGKENISALDKDQHWEQTLVPMGILEIESAKSTVIVGNSNETSDFIVDGFEKWYEIEKERLDLKSIHTLEIYADNGPAIHSHRTQFIKRMMEFACITNLNIHLIYYPPYHSKYNPIERVWAAVEQYWNGTILSSVDKVINTLKNVKWKNINLNALFIDKVYQKGISLSDKEMVELEAFLIRKPDLEKWDVWIKPSFQMGILFFE
jgi:transposase